MSAQFDDAEDDQSPTTLLPTATPSFTAPLAPATAQPGREIGRVDDPDAHGHLNSDGEYEHEEEEDEDEYYYSEEEGQWDLEQGMAALNSQDWAEGSGDFTKRYNRMRQHVVVTHAAQAAPRSSLASALSSSSTSAPSSSSSLNSTARPLNILPATNRSRQPPRPSAPNGTGSTSSGSAAVHLNKVTDQLAHLGARYGSQLQLEPLYPTSAQATRKGGSEKILIKDKADRATNEQVLDPRTRLILFKMLGRELITRVDGCVSTGKEANVYHAMAPENRHFALKIYKTSILIFKDRDRYVTGEFRFKSGYARSNPRKMVRLWAEKEMRNLRRLRAGGIRCPEPIEVRENVLVMEFMAMNVDKEGEEGEEWQASPRLKDADIPQEDVRRLYIEILVILRTIFMRCKLVHADFSEYNILYHNSHLHVIDVSQSVEQDHPSAFDFLRSDIKNADDFFARRGIDTLGLTRTFNYVTKPSWVIGRSESDEDMTEEAERIVRAVEEDVAEEEEEIDHNASSNKKVTSTNTASSTKPSASDEAVFAQSYIPRALDQVYDIERDVARVLRGEGDDLIYADITGVAKIKKMEGEAAVAGEGAESGEKKEKKKVRVLAEGEVEVKHHEENDEEDGSEEASGSGSENESGSEESDGEGGYKQRRPRGKKHEDKDEKKKRRQETKEAAREKRSVKMKKGEKARKVKKSSGKK